MGLCLSLCVLALCVADYYKPERTRFVTRSKEGNYLFRGNEPLNEDGKGSVAFGKLHEAFVKYARANGISLPDDYFLIDVSFLDPHTLKPDHHDILVEQRDASTKNHSKFLNLELYGEKTGPYQLSDSVRETSAKSVPIWQNDKLVSRVSAVNDILSTTYELPIVVYVHCEQGVDRTGEFVGAYALKYLGFTWDKVNADNHAIASRPVMREYQNALQWYCEYLRITENASLQCRSSPTKKTL
eukprot:JP436449.1.p1 GENE.JP436449.1~~JP436449.1.p1  ORF type:complete len:242 (+),score=44.62 JP436449.1:1-726(+)